MKVSYDKITIRGIDVYVVTSHHFVLAPWAEIRRTLANAPTLITLDHHTDTMEPFHIYLYEMSGGHSDVMEKMLPGLITGLDWKDDHSVASAVDMLNHDEHIRTAVLSGILFPCVCH